MNKVKTFFVKPFRRFSVQWRFCSVPSSHSKQVSLDAVGHRLVACHLKIKTKKRKRYTSQIQFVVFLPSLVDGGGGRIARPQVLGPVTPQRTWRRVLGARNTECGDPSEIKVRPGLALMILYLSKNTQYSPIAKHFFCNISTHSGRSTFSASQRRGLFYRSFFFGAVSKRGVFTGACLDLLSVLPV